MGAGTARTATRSWATRRMGRRGEKSIMVEAQVKLVTGAVSANMAGFYPRPHAASDPRAAGDLEVMLCYDAETKGSEN